MVSTLQLLRTNENHIGDSPLNKVGTDLVKKNIESVQSTFEGKANKNSFENYLVEALDYVNNTQITSSNMSEQIIIDPDSVDVHDVTIAMAQANLSLSLAQNVIDRITKAWSEITTTR